MKNIKIILISLCTLQCTFNNSKFETNNNDNTNNLDKLFKSNDSLFFPENQINFEEKIVLDRTLNEKIICDDTLIHLSSQKFNAEMQLNEVYIYINNDTLLLRKQDFYINNNLPYLDDYKFVFIGLEKYDCNNDLLLLMVGVDKYDTDEGYTFYFEKKGKDIKYMLLEEKELDFN